MAKSVVILDGARTPMAEYEGGKTGDGRPGGALKSVTALDLGAVASRGAIERAGIAPEAVDAVFFGNALQTSGDAIYGARHVGLKAGVPLEKPALTVNRLCGSGIQSVVSAVHSIGHDEATVCLAGGMESMSQAPHVIRGARSGFRLGQGKLEDLLMVALLDTYCGLYMANTAENIAADRKLTREAQDQFSLESQQRGAAARERGVHAEEIVPVETGKGRRARTVDTDDHLKPDSTLEGLGALPPAFGKDGTVTAGNASGIVDGAAALVLQEEEAARSDGHSPLARIRSWGTVGVPPEYMGIGPVPAIRLALSNAGMSLADVDLFEINEAFAAQYLAVEHDLELDRAKVNVNGGAISLGHPLAATGTRLLLTLAYELRRRGGGVGVASACIGGGQGIAMVIESGS
ncbi:MAG: acetyl-CoA C-acetyltransferase [Gemmatimonadota bacterium]|jgi:acetyl-CoA acetyltransferase family protein|nr:acetyl-CoA C-acetyltransferase [Gemmatimonadota bacterium]MDP6529798.1 acetyl-CoA C-acetyltransferase [Gemmatimonadota bacterium]MDP6802990.1 acetyl-CoA C-acetyltransferase [Gemmatimonadota bacterium]MDP7032605.1 acetyl-CoA C-acetyltransferase [Gemmatimonadota bacterium]